jgi:hypothetical protein
MYQIYYLLMNVINYMFVLSIVFVNESREILLCAREVMDLMYGYDNIEEITLVIKEIKEKKEIKERYEDKYLTKFNALIDKDIDNSVINEQINNRFIMEMTPVGNVIMQYNLTKELFVYYSDNIVPFRYLETVARKYVCTFDCKELYIMRQETAVIKPTNLSIKTKDLMNQKMNPSQNKKETTTIEVKMNRYSNAGRFSNFNMLIPIAKHITDKKRLMRFSDFKKLNVGV